MIAKLTGTIDEIKPTELILNVMGVGYHVYIPLSTFEKVHDQSEVVLYIYTLHREDQLSLYGFNTIKEKELFVTLLHISGIGPAMALSILSGISLENLVHAIKTENTALLTKIPGIGKAKAEKLVFELKRKFKKLEDFVQDSPGTISINRDAIDALTSLGFDERKAYEVIEKVLTVNPEATIEAVVKEALKLMSG